jgi:integrase
MSEEVLGLQAGQVVGVSELCEFLWGDDPTRWAVKTVQTYVSGLRQALGAAVIETSRGGYRLCVSPGEVDIGQRRDGPTLVRHNGHRLDRRTAHRWVQFMGKRAGLGPVHPHMLGAGFIKAALDAGVPLREVQVAARHSAPGRPRCTTGAARTLTATPPTSS